MVLSAWVGGYVILGISLTCRGYTTVSGGQCLGERVCDPWHVTHLQGIYHGQWWSVPGWEVM